MTSSIDDRPTGPLGPLARARLQALLQAAAEHESFAELTTALRDLGSLSWVGVVAVLWPGVHPAPSDTTLRYWVRQDRIAGRLRAPWAWVGRLVAGDAATWAEFEAVRQSKGRKQTRQPTGMDGAREWLHEALGAPEDWTLLRQVLWLQERVQQGRLRLEVADPEQSGEVA